MIGATQIASVETTTELSSVALPFNATIAMVKNQGANSIYFLFGARQDITDAPTLAPGEAVTTELATLGELRAVFFRAVSDTTRVVVMCDVEDGF